LTVALEDFLGTVPATKRVALAGDLRWLISHRSDVRMDCRIKVLHPGHANVPE
jgi:hypothetical protein